MVRDNKYWDCKKYIRTCILTSIYTPVHPSIHSHTHLPAAIVAALYACLFFAEVEQGPAAGRHLCLAPVRPHGVNGGVEGRGGSLCA